MQLRGMFTILGRRPGYVSSALRIGCISAISVEYGRSRPPSCRVRLPNAIYTRRCSATRGAAFAAAPVADSAPFTDMNVIFAAAPPAGTGGRFSGGPGRRPSPNRCSRRPRAGRQSRQPGGQPGAASGKGRAAGARGGTARDSGRGGTGTPDPPRTAGTLRFPENGINALKLR